MKKAISMVFVIALLLSLCGCGSNNAFSEETVAMSFSDAISIDSIKALDGKNVTIMGYMATLSPISGKYMYLMNLPYQSCPFCVPNTSQLSNTMAVYAKEGDTFTFTDQAIKVKGKLEVGDSTDDFGYEYNYRIVDATIEEVDLSTVSDQYKMWQTIAADGIVADIYSMYDYLNFLCQWTEYQSSYTDDDGNTVTYMLYAGDVMNYLEDDGVYGYADKCNDTYFPSLIERVRAISETELEDLVQLIEEAEEVANYALTELYDGNYTYVEDEDKYVLDKDEELYQKWYNAYLDFSQWLTKWQM